MMEAEGKLKSCKQAKCNISKDGKCLEGLPLDQCPHFLWVNEIEIATTSSDDKKKPNTPLVQLLSGEEWDLKNVKEVTNKFSTKRIYIIGDSDSGKTTLLVRLFNSFQLGPFKNFLFAGSTTLIGFERRIHLTKIESNSDKEQTEKTKSQEFSFLHLALKQKTNLLAEPIHLLLSDISGERIQLARDSSTEMKELILLKNSDFIIIMIDGAKIADRKDRMAAILKSQTFLRQALDDGIITRKNKVRILLSKWDLLYSLEGFDYDEEIVSPFKHAFQDRLPDISFYRICSRSSCPAEIPSYYGIEELLNDWTAMDSYKIDRADFLTEKKSDRAFSNYFIA